MQLMLWILLGTLWVRFSCMESVILTDIVIGFLK